MLEFAGKHIYVMVEGFEQGNLSLLVRPDRLGPIPEPMLSVATRQMLRALAVIHSHGVACDGKLTSGSFWLSRDGQLKLGPLFHFNIPEKKNMSYAISDDVHALLEACVQLADARSEDSQMLARHELEFKIKQYEHKLNSLRKDKADIVKRQASAQSSGKQVASEPARSVCASFGFRRQRSMVGAHETRTTDYIPHISLATAGQKAADVGRHSTCSC